MTPREGAWREPMAQSDLSGGSSNPLAREGTGFLCHAYVAIQVCLLISTRGLARYRAVLSLPGAAAFFAAAAVARLGVAMTILGVLWAVRGATGSFASAGVATAVFALADATAGPQVARLVEDRGQRRVLPWSAAVFVLAVSGLIVGAGLRLPLAALALMAMAAGASVPPVGSFSAARWRHAGPDPGPGGGGTVAGSRAQRRDPPVRPDSRQRAERRAVPGRRD